jgi:hypothetical protein
MGIGGVFRIENLKSSKWLFVTQLQEIEKRRKTMPRYLGMKKYCFSQAITSQTWLNH